MSNLSTFSTSINENPFDFIRRFDEQGNEFWTGRDLMLLIGYSKWQRFEDATQRAKIACKNSGNNIEDHFTDAGNLVKRGQGGGSKQTDYKLSRYACYLIAMNGDPRKPEIAAAQTYFAVKTRQAETAIPAQSERIKELELTLQIEKERNQQRQLDHAMLVLHGKELVLTLRGKDDQIVRVETVVTEVVEPKTQATYKILTADQLKKEVKNRTGQKLESAKWFTDKLRKMGRDDLLTPVTRHVTGEYISPDNLEEAIKLVYEDSKQLVLGQ